MDEHFVRVGGKSYAINKINSVEVRQKSKSGRWGWMIAWPFAGLVAISGLGATFSGQNGAGAFVIAAIIGFGGWLSFRKRHRTFSYELYLMTSSSEVQAFATSDGASVDELRSAIEQAMIGRVAVR